MTEPLGPSRRDAIGWRSRQGLADMANRFHYYRITEDDRILWGGYDAVYRYASSVDPDLEQQGPTHARLAEHFFETFPQLEGLRFTHRWAGVIDTCSRFCQFWGTALDGRVSYVLGYTGAGVELRAPWGSVRAPRAVLATNAFRPLLRRLRFHVVPVYDYALMTEPLSEAQLDSIGWPRRQALADAGSMFHYYRLTEDQRILWGGWDAMYYRGRRIRKEYEERPDLFAKLAGHFFTTFPRLEGLSFTHRWAGVIDTCSRFCQFWGTAVDGRVAYAVGYTGLGVAASRFGARVALDLALGRRTQLTELDFVRSRPLPFPPEPLLFPVIEATRRSTEHAELHGGRRNAWLRALDRFGLGFDS
jgi:glycine/D-amino acid oxidase-like deaminating enzyme